jgi:ribonuclease III
MNESVSEIPVAFEALQTRLGYRFTKPALLILALTHPTFLHENPEMCVDDNQRLEFLGDAVIGLVVGHLLMERFPRGREGDLTRMRAALVSEKSLAKLARQLGIGDFLRMGRGEVLSGGQEKPSILADAFEAMMAAIYIDGGFDSVFDVIAKAFSPLLTDAGGDPKSRLQEMVQKEADSPPVYRVLAEEGPDHQKVFTVEVRVGEICVTASGSSKKKAEKGAARKALAMLNPK